MASSMHSILCGIEYDAGVIGIDTGITLLMAENLRTGLIWKVFMKSAEAKRGLDRAGFRNIPEH